RLATGGDQQVRAHDLAGLAVAVERHDDVVAALRQAETPGVGVHGDPLTAEERRHRLGDLLVLARDQARPDLDDRHFAAETAEHLAELEADIAAAQHQQMARQEINIHHRAVGEVGDAVEAGNLRDRRPAADIEEDPAGAQGFAADHDLMRPDEAAVTLIDGAVLAALERSFDAPGRLAD